MLLTLLLEHGVLLRDIFKGGRGRGVGFWVDGRCDRVALGTELGV